MEETQHSKDDARCCQNQQLNADSLGKEGAEHLAREELLEAPRQVLEFLDAKTIITKS